MASREEMSTSFGAVATSTTFGTGYVVFALVAFVGVVILLAPRARRTWAC